MLVNTKTKTVFSTQMKVRLLYVGLKRCSSAENAIVPYIFIYIYFFNRTLKKYIQYITMSVFSVALLHTH